MEGLDRRLTSVGTWEKKLMLVSSPGSLDAARLEAGAFIFETSSKRLQVFASERRGRESDQTKRSHYSVAETGLDLHAILLSCLSFRYQPASEVVQVCFGGGSEMIQSHF